MSTNLQQNKAINTVKGPVLIIAGPGTGKTYTLVQRVVHLINEGVKPENILISTFTDKAAKEIVTRISNELDKQNIFVNLNEMYIGTFHSICGRILKENIEYTSLSKQYQILDESLCRYIVRKHMYDFRQELYNMTNLGNNQNMQINNICNYASIFSDELIDAELVAKDTRKDIQDIGKAVTLYRKIMKDNNYIDFGLIQKEAYDLVTNNQNVLKMLQDKFKYIMVDEYQDTNYIEEQLISLLALPQNNICVVGDDDQSMYRFRGATIKNILTFQEKYTDCTIIKLETNYRSEKDIVDFYNKWMGNQNWTFGGRTFRFNKTITTPNKSNLNSPAVVSIRGNQNKHCDKEKQIYSFIKALKDSGKITDYNQIAFLFSSLKKDEAKNLRAYLVNNGIPVYSPRSKEFFDRDEVKFLIGYLLWLFPAYSNEFTGLINKFLENGNGYDKKEVKTFLNKLRASDRKSKHHYTANSILEYYIECMYYVINIGNNMTWNNESDRIKFNKFIREQRSIQNDFLNGAVPSLNYNFTKLLYKCLEFYPISKFIDTPPNEDVINTRPIRNISRLINIVRDYENLNNIESFSHNKFLKHVDAFFKDYIGVYYTAGIDEYEDDSEYAPSGCVSFITMHQAKGLEFPIVFVGSMEEDIWGYDNKQKDYILNTYGTSENFEPKDQINTFDFNRKYYTAFSRAENLLVLIDNTNNRGPFKELMSQLPTIASDKFNINDFEFNNVKDVNLKECLSFTSHISLFENCPLQYKFYKYYGFPSVKASGMIFGTLVHSTIEDIHKAALRGEVNTITETNVKNWFYKNYNSISQAENTYLQKSEYQGALNQVLRYVRTHDGDWSMVRKAEVDVSLVKPEYIIEGTIDLIKGQGDNVEIIDFKSEKKPTEIEGNERLSKYHNQLNVYSYLVEKRTNLKVNKMHLYYTGDSSDNPKITFEYNNDEVTNTIDKFDNIAHSILNKDFNGTYEKCTRCDNCDFKYYCKSKI